MTVLVVLFGLALFGLALLRYLQPFPFDDGAFFLRYAENLAAGHGYVWNEGVRDAIGASAPYWPPLLALPILLGIEPYLAAQGMGFALMLVTCGVLLSTTRLVFGHSAWLPLVLALASAAPMLVCAMGGMETSLTVLLLAVAMRILASERPRPVLAGAFAAVLVVHKLDLLPWAAGMLVAGSHWRLQKGHRSGLLVFAAIVLLHLLAMWVVTGHVLPVSLVRKLTNSAGGVPTVRWTWFVDAALWGNRRWLLLALALLGTVQLLRARSRVSAFLAVGVAGQVMAYSVFPPTEPFVWYTVPVALAACVLSSGAVAFVHGCLGDRGRSKVVPAVTLLVLAICAHVLYRGERVRRHWLDYSAHIEADRSRAGMWVAEHAPEEFRVVTGFGCPAYYCDRFVYDYSGLNMTGDVSLDHLIATHRPELLILCPHGSGVLPADHLAPDGYRTAAVFDSTLREQKTDFYAVVLVREDCAEQLAR